MKGIEWTLSTVVVEIFYCVIGAIFIATGVSALKNDRCEKPVTTCIFWTLIGIAFIIGLYILKWIIGAIVIALSVFGLGLVKPAAKKCANC